MGKLSTFHIRRSKLRLTSSNNRWSLNAFHSYLFYDINSMRFFGQPFGLTSSGSDLHSLIAAAQTAGNVIHSLARLPWLKKQIFSSRLGKRYLAPRPNDGSPIGEVINVSNITPIYTYQ